MVTSLLVHCSSLDPRLVRESRVTQLLRIIRVGKGMADTASTTTMRRIASATSIRHLGMCRSSWLTTYLACAAWCFGRITILWQRMYSSKLLVTSGYAGHPLRSALPLWTRGPHISESEPRLVVTPDNQAIAIWTVRPETSKSAIMAATSNDGRHFTKPQQISVAGSNIHGCKAPKFLELTAPVVLLRAGCAPTIGMVRSTSTHITCIAAGADRICS